MLSLKPLSQSAIPAALAKAERYRLLNEPAQAESICEDVLAADPDNAQALVTLILAITDGFPTDAGHGVQSCAGAGIASPRRIRARVLRRPGSRASRACAARPRWPGPPRPRRRLAAAGDAAYERAEAVRPPDNDDALLRWNACVRLCQLHPGLLQQDERRTTPVMLE